jgi:recombination protein RecT
MPVKSPTEERALVKVDAAKTVQAMAGTITKGGAEVPVRGLVAFRELLESRKGSIGSVAASFMSPERIIKVVLNSVDRTPKLAQCTGNSIFRSVLAAAELGLDPGGALNQAYLVPFKAECTLIVGYQGIVDLAFRSERVVSVNAAAVYEGDVYEEEGGLAPKLRHVKGRGPRDPKKLTHAYAVIQLKDGGLVYDSMTRAEVDAIRARSRSRDDGPWVTDYAEMAKKTVLRRTLKLCPKSTEMKQALALENAVDSGESTAGILEAEWTEADTDKGDTKGEYAPVASISRSAT